jgi:hypothetical protein
VINPDGTKTPIPRIKEGEHYRYLGVWISLNLDWNKHIQYVDEKIARYTYFLSNRCFTAAQCVLAINRILIPRACYGFIVAQITEQKLKAWDKRIASLIHRKLRISTLRSPKMLHASYEQGGVALLSLLHMHKALRAAAMYHSLNNFDEQTRTVAQTTWETCLSKQKTYGHCERKVRNNVREQRTCARNTAIIANPKLPHAHNQRHTTQTQTLT